jgi:hypothetical protein
VGYGDLHPETHQGQIFTIFFALYSITILGIFLGFIGDMVVERQRQHRKDAMNDCRWRYMAAFQHGTLQHRRHPPATTPCTILEDIQAEQLQEEGGGGGEEEIACNNQSSLQSLIIKIDCSIIRDNTWSILILIATAIPVIVIEKWDAMKGVYWMVVTATTIGLGDETTLQPVSHTLCIVYIPVAVYLTGRFVGLVASAFVDRRDHAAELKFMRRAFTLSDVERMDFNNDGVVSERKFLIYMLVTLQKVEQDDIDEILKLFHKLDKTGDGVLTTDDLEKVSSIPTNSHQVPHDPSSNSM